MVQGLAFLSKKSWHTKNLVNQEKVWIAEEQKKAEKAKTTELARQIQQEREQDEIDQITGGKKRNGNLVDRGIDWMYNGHEKSSEIAKEDAEKKAEEYLLGKEYNPSNTKIVGDLEIETNDGVNAVIASAAAKSNNNYYQPESQQQQDQDINNKYYNNEPTVAQRNEAFRVRLEDPMYQVTLQTVQKEKDNEKKRNLYEKALGVRVIVGGGVEPVKEEAKVITTKENDTSKIYKEKKLSKKHKKKEKSKKSKKSKKRRREYDDSSDDDSHSTSSSSRSRSRRFGRWRKHESHNHRDDRSLSRSSEDSYEQRKYDNRRLDDKKRNDVESKLRIKEKTRDYDISRDKSNRQNPRNRSRSRSSTDTDAYYYRRKKYERGIDIRGDNPDRHRNYDRMEDSNRIYKDDDRSRNPMRNSDRQYNDNHHDGRKSYVRNDYYKDSPKYSNSIDVNRRKPESNLSSNHYERDKIYQKHDSQYDRYDNNRKRPPSPPRDKKRNYGLQRNSNMVHKSSTVTDLGPDVELLRKKQKMEEEQKRQIQQQRTSSINDNRKQLTKEERDAAIREMQNDANIRTNTSRIDKKIIYNDDDDDHHNNNKDNKLGNNNSQYGGNNFLHKLAKDVHGAESTTNSTTLAERLQQKRNTNQKFHDDTFL